MPIESADDLAVFFNPDEFGEAVTYNGFGGLTAIWTRPTGALPFGDTTVVVDTNVFSVQVADVPAPAVDDTIVVARTGETFTVNAEPKRSRDGSLWTLEVEPG